jgi:hypothetical protein
MPTGQYTGNSAELIRSEVWSAQLKDILRDELFATRWVETLDGFPDGTTFTIPSVGDASVDDYEEGQDVVYRPLATGEFQFTITEYLSSGLSMTKQLMQDSFYAERVLAEFVPKEHRAIMEHFEATTLSKPEGVLGASANGQYTINGKHHRMSGGNTGAIEAADFAYALMALKTANVPQQNLVAICDPSVEFTLNTISNLVTLSDNPRWEGIVADGIASGMKFVKNVYGFDVYTSQYLPSVTDSALPERDGSTTNDFSSTAGVANYFFSASQDVLPLVGAWRQDPEVDYQYNQDKQQHEWVTTARYGVELFRPENMVSIVTTPAVS